MAGLSVLLETTDESDKAQLVISKATLHSPKASSSSSSPAAAARCAARKSSFLQRCSLCHKELAEDNDIYMYRGDMAFCSVECRCRRIFMDEDGGGGGSYRGVNGAATRASSQRANGGGGVSFAAY